MRAAISACALLALACVPEGIDRARLNGADVAELAEPPDAESPELGKDVVEAPLDAAAEPDAANEDAAPEDAAAEDASEPALDAEPPPVDECPRFSTGDVAGSIASEELTEASGLAASRANLDVLWAHNDSGDGPRLFALGTDGRDLGQYDLAGAAAEDWEDIEIGPGPAAGSWYLYVGDIGDNTLARGTIVVYRVLEPIVSASQGPASRPLAGAEALPAQYPGGVARNAEALLIDPITSDLIIATKSDTGISEIFRYPPPLMPGTTVTLELLTEIDLAAASSVLVTGGEISPAGDELVLRTTTDAYLWRRAAGQSIADMLANVPCPIPLRPEPQGEAITFAPDGARYFTVTEEPNGNPPLHRFQRLP